jgi:hypothetical protein
MYRRRSEKALGSVIPRKDAFAHLASPAPLLRRGAICILGSQREDNIMAKGQMRSNKEAKKPKQKKPTAAPVTSNLKGSATPILGPKKR